MQYALELHRCRYEPLFSMCGPKVPIATPRRNEITSLKIIVYVVNKATFWGPYHHLTKGREDQGP